MALIVRQGVILTASGLFVGSAAALFLVRLLRNQVYGVDIDDPATYGFVCLLLLSVGVLASAIPAWRASRVDPVIALRHEL